MRYIITSGVNARQDVCHSFESQHTAREFVVRTYMSMTDAELDQLFREGFVIWDSPFCTAMWIRCTVEEL